MSNWTERLQEEKRELEAKITSLDEFMQSSDCCELEPVDVSLMDELMIAMEDCLGWVNDGLERAEATRDEEGYKNYQVDINKKCLVEIDKSLIEHYYKTEAPKEEYVTSSTANSDNVNKAKSIFEDAMDEHLAERAKDFVRDEKTREPHWYSEEDYREWHRWLTVENKARTKDSIVETEMTPNALLALGFEEQYQGVDMGNPGYIYYTLHLLGMELCSSVVGDDKPFHVVAGDEGEFIIHNLRKLGDLILSLKEVS